MLNIHHSWCEFVIEGLQPRNDIYLLFAVNVYIALPYNNACISWLIVTQTGSVH